MQKPALATASYDNSEMWQVDTSAGPKFAALNGDINLIHLSPLLARLFGFPSNIAHGVFLLSKSVAAMQRGGASSAMQDCFGCFMCMLQKPQVKLLYHTCMTSVLMLLCVGAPHTYPQAVTASFVRPAVLPGQYTCQWQEGAGALPFAADFAVLSMLSGKPVVTGQYTVGQTAVAKF